MTNIAQNLTINGRSIDGVSPKMEISIFYFLQKSDKTSKTF